MGSPSRCHVQTSESWGRTREEAGCSLNTKNGITDCGSHSVWFEEIRSKTSGEFWFRFCEDWPRFTTAWWISATRLEKLWERVPFC